MQVDRLEEIYERLKDLVTGNGTQEAVIAQLGSLGQAIAELKRRPETYIRPDLVHAKFEWTEDNQKFGFLLPPYTRVDGMRVFCPHLSDLWYADFPDMGNIGDSLGRKRNWKSAANAMAYLDRDYPAGGDWRRTNG